jgi:hypothetical protein
VANALLNVPLMNQTTDFWCWAAVASAVSAYFHPHLPFMPPCDVASRVPGSPGTCCPVPNGCLFRAGLDEAFRAIGLSQARPVPPLLFATVADLVIRQRFPVGVRLVGAGVAGHFVLIVGCDDTRNEVIVTDPSGAPGLPSWRGAMSYDKLLTNYGSWAGRCTHSILIG